MVGQGVSQLERFDRVSASVEATKVDVVDTLCRLLDDVQDGDGHPDVVRTFVDEVEVLIRAIVREERRLY